ncbi:ParB/Srx family N-terminal domain-containing protein [Sodalis ligni]|uniref:ParB-like nuclease family protein n=1 Tax=Sodalis ligni TaxID=2697027 RepID=A0A4R1NAP1_9GAMM|nr:ParB/Srx family N-terminal domain-containing protein [Sodalis ligni]TCL03807.1 hypothetical protein EZJ58_1893 [Sodalis ligni]
MFENKSLKVSDLMLDPENSRFSESADNQREAIKIMLESQGKKIERLAKDISEHGVDPSERLIVVASEDEGGGYFVKEGNRRITALKLIENPSLAQNKSIETVFDKIKKTTKFKVDVVDCVIYTNDEYLHWINLKHTGQNDGAGRVGWTTPEQLRYMARNGKESFANQLYSFVDLFPDYFSNIIKSKNKISITNLGRLVLDPAFRKHLNLNGVDGVLYCSQPIKRFIEQYKRILDVMIAVDDKGKTVFTVNRIRSKDDRRDFISDLKLTPFSPVLDKEWRLLEPPKIEDYTQPQDNNSPASEDNEKGKEQSTDTGEKDTGIQQGQHADERASDGTSSESNSNNQNANGDNTGGKKGSNPHGVKRNHVVPMNITLSFGKNYKRCHRIFTELKRMSHDEFQNSIAVMLRVFIELSLNTYIEHEKLVFSDKKNPGRTPGLHDTVIMVSDSLFEKKIISGSKKTAILAYSKQLTAAKSSLHQYVHNADLIPEREFVNTEWDNFQPLIVAIWEVIS